MSLSSSCPLGLCVPGPSPSWVPGAGCQQGPTRTPGAGRQGREVRRILGSAPALRGGRRGRTTGRLGLSDRASLDHGWAFARPGLLSWEEQAGGDPGPHTNKLWRQTTS